MELTKEKYRFLSGELHNLRREYNEKDVWVEEELYVIVKGVKGNVTEPINIGDNFDDFRDKLGWNDVQRVEDVEKDCVIYDYSFGDMDDIPFNDINGYVVVNVAYDLYEVTSVKLWS